MPKLAKTALSLAAILSLAAAPLSAQVVCTPTSTSLIAGQHFYAGEIRVTYDRTTLCVTYATEGDWEITETHLAVGDELDAIPHAKKGNPIPGKFQYQATHDPSVSSFTYCVNYSSASGVPIYIATHAAVQMEIDDSGSYQEETAWGGDQPFPGRNWATYFVYVPDCGPLPE